MRQTRAGETAEPFRYSQPAIAAKTQTMEMNENKAIYASLAEQAYDLLEEKIVTLQLAPGAVLSEQQLAKELGVGRSPVREALQRLAHEGLVVVLPRRGVLVSEINISTHNKLLEVRREVERLMARVACRSANEKQCQEFLKLAREFERTARENDALGFVRVDARFNELVSESVDNEFAVRAIQLMRGLTRRFWFKYYKIADLKKCALLHAKMARAIAKRDPEASAAALDRLIDYMQEFTRATLGMA